MTPEMAANMQLGRDLGMERGHYSHFDSRKNYPWTAPFAKKAIEQEEYEFAYDTIVTAWVHLGKLL